VPVAKLLPEFCGRRAERRPRADADDHAQKGEDEHGSPTLRATPRACGGAALAGPGCVPIVCMDLLPPWALVRCGRGIDPLRGPLEPIRGMFGPLVRHPGHRRSWDFRPTRRTGVRPRGHRAPVCFDGDGASSEEAAVIVGVPRRSRTTSTASRSRPRAPGAHGGGPPGGARGGCRRRVVLVVRPLHEGRGRVRPTAAAGCGARRHDPQGEGARARRSTTSCGRGRSCSPTSTCGEQGADRGDAGPQGERRGVRDGAAPTGGSPSWPR
jgi:hypothetical protein